MAVGQLLEFFPSPVRYFKLTDLHLKRLMYKKIKVDVKRFDKLNVPAYFATLFISMSL